MPEEYILQLGAVAIIFLFAIKEFFVFLKNRNFKNNDKDFIKELKENHLKGMEATLGNLQYMSRETDKKLEKIINILIEMKEKLK